MYEGPSTPGQAARSLVPSLFWVIVAVVLAFILLTITTWGGTEQREIGLHYSGGLIEDKEFIGVIPQGQAPRPIGLMDTVIKLPSNQRTYITARGSRGDSGVLTATNKDGNLIEFETSMTFSLPEDEEALKGLYEDICTKYNDCEQGGSNGWNAMLDDYLRKIQETTLQTVSRTLTSAEMSKNTEAFPTIAQAVNERLPEQVIDTMGGPYLEVGGFQVNNIHPPESVLNEYEELTARNIEQQQAEAQAATAEELEETLKDPAYLENKKLENEELCIKSGDCRVLYIPKDSIVQVPGE